MINRVVLVGRLTKDPELRITPSGIPVARFTLAVNRPFTNQQGEREADFINCVVWRKQAENVANYLKKGSLAGVDGRLQTGSYDGQDGKRVFFTEVVCDSVQFLEPRSASSGSGGQFGGQRDQSGFYGYNQNQPDNYEQPGYTRVDDGPFADTGQIDISDDDLPF